MPRQVLGHGKRKGSVEKIKHTSLLHLSEIITYSDLILNSPFVILTPSEAKGKNPTGNQ